ncbi:glutamate-5-semialdehyde dehydrogenase [Catonella morbi ATCC 51271]|uniref:Gamma-glutamyl phosphate reductase n=1 Tax=Catonella morbi ATCC 51271 TaxID=592026 RepID=V2ZCU6_9FIRM|nr:glutamate-5-semialdehyde dehydrogenase [Catonella morbi]ESL04750.1 glutamate-5-semialdehyde dehydrogenase [Catonella morbi ATCC 51271]
MINKLQAAKNASYKLALLSSDTKNQVLRDCAKFITENSDEIIAANKLDMEAGRSKNMSEGLLDRLLLTDERIKGIAASLEELALLSDPIGEISSMIKRPNGLMIGRKRVPIGVIGVIYEARPNVTADSFGICFKSGNAVVLRGGSDAINSCKAIVKTIKQALAENGIDENAVTYIEDEGHDGIKELITANDYVDLVIPRGGAGLIEFVVKNATVPAIHTGTGNCHVYVDEYANLQMAVKIIVNAKTTRLGVCNACESLVVHKAVLDKFAPLIYKALSEHGVEIRADEEAEKYCEGFVPAAEEDWGKEYLDRIISLKSVDSIEEAVLHINKYNTGHSETIITDNIQHAEYFTSVIDAACVYVNASTRFTDGGEFGLGAEIGISTQKIHARGPMGLKELTCEKYIILGDGQIRE